LDWLEHNKLAIKERDTIWADIISVSRVKGGEVGFGERSFER
jgi:hypothetical protein